MSRHRLLLVEDNDELREMLRLYLGQRGFDVIPVADGESALAEARQHRPDVVILDLVLPGIDGVQVLAEMATETTLADVPVILYTGIDAGDPRIAAAQTMPRVTYQPKGALTALGAALDQLLATARGVGGP